MTSSKRVKSTHQIGQLHTISTEHFYIFTNTEDTEKNYFEGLKYSFNQDPINLENKAAVKIKVKSTPLQQLVFEAKTCKNTVTQLNSKVWIVLDYDRDIHFDEIIQNAKDEGIPVAWSNPCFEVWLWAYLDQIPTDIGDSQQLCIDEFERVFYKKTGQDYRKNDEKIYNRLKKSGNENKAFERAEVMRKAFPEGLPPSKMGPSTKVDLLVKMILRK